MGNPTKVYAIIVIVETFGCVACSQQKATIVEAEKAVASTLRDPDAAKFRDVNASVTGVATNICGEVNGKNAFGAYAGYRKFSATKIKDRDWSVVVQSDDSTEEQGRRCEEFLSKQDNHGSTDAAEFEDVCGSIDSTFWVVYLGSCSRSTP